MGALYKGQCYATYSEVMAAACADVYDVVPTTNNGQPFVVRCLGSFSSNLQLEFSMQGTYGSQSILLPGPANVACDPATWLAVSGSPGAAGGTGGSGGTGGTGGTGGMSVIAQLTPSAFGDVQVADHMQIFWGLMLVLASVWGMKRLSKLFTSDHE